MANDIRVEKDLGTHFTNYFLENNPLNMKKERIINDGDDVIGDEMLISGAASGGWNEATLVVIKRNPHNRIGKWNVQSLYQNGKLENV